MPNPTETTCRWCGNAIPNPKREQHGPGINSISGAPYKIRPWIIARVFTKHASTWRLIAEDAGPNPLPLLPEPANLPLVAPRNPLLRRNDPLPLKRRMIESLTMKSEAEITARIQELRQRLAKQKDVRRATVKDTGGRSNFGSAVVRNLEGEISGLEWVLGMQSGKQS